MSDSWTPAALDYTGFLAYLQQQGANIFRMYVWEQAFAGQLSGQPDPLPYPRTGPGLDNFGFARFDLSQFNPDFFARLLARVTQASNAGIYVVVVLFNGASLVSRGGTKDPWPSHPFNAGNNINAVNGDPSLHGNGQDMMRSLISAVTLLQQAYVAKVLAVLNGLDNVLYEIANEAADDLATVGWVNAMVAYTRGYDAGLAKQHPIGVSANYPTVNSAAINGWLAASGADWIAPYGIGSYDTAPPVATGSQVVIVDSAHTFAATPAGDALWVWEQFCTGNNVLYIDDLSATGVVGSTETSSGTPLSQETSARAGLLGVRTVANMTDISLLTPTPAASSTGYALVAPKQSYVVLARFSPFSVDLSASTSSIYNINWISLATGKATGGGSQAGGNATTLFNAPSLPIVLVLTIAPSTISVITPSGVVAGVQVVLSGGYTGIAPVAFDYSTDGGNNWFAVTTLTVSAGSWTGSGPTFSAAATSQTIKVRNHALVTETATTGTFSVAAAPVEVLTVNTPVGVKTGVAVVLTGSFIVVTPTALDYSLDARLTWTAMTGVSFGAGTWTGTGPTYAAASTSSVIWVRDHNAPLVAAATAAFAVTLTVVPVETLSILTPQSATAGTPLVLSGGYTNGPPAAFDYSIDAGTNWSALTAATIGSGSWSGTGPTFPVFALARQVTVRDRFLPSITAQTGTFNVAGETLTVTTPVGVLVGTAVTLTGTYAGGTPTAFDYSLDSGSTWFAMTSVSVASGNWSGVGPTFTAGSTSAVITVRDHAQVLVKVATGSFPVGVPISETLTVATPTSATVGTPLPLSGTFHNGSPTAFDYSITAGVWFVMTAVTVSTSAETWSGVGPTFSAIQTGAIVTVRDHASQGITAATGPFPVVSGVVEVLTINTPSGVLVGNAVSLSGTYANGTPTALDYSIDNALNWVALASPTIAGGNWSGTGPTFAASSTSQIILIRDHNATAVTATTGSFAIGAAQPETISVNTPINVVTGTAVPLSGTFANVALAAVDYSLDGGVTWTAVSPLTIGSGVWSGPGPIYTTTP